MQKKRIIVLLADGARYDVLKEAIASGACPNIRDAFLSRGTFARATTVFPSATGPAYMPFLTGCYPGTCNVPGIRWFDKSVYSRGRISFKKFRSYVGFESLLMKHDMRPDWKTLFEYFPKSFNVFNRVNRGVAPSRNLYGHMQLWYWYYGHLTDRWSLVDRAALDRALVAVKSDFEFLFAVFPGIDTLSHLLHPSHEAVLGAYRSFDAAVGCLVDELKRSGKLDETALFIVSDHGLSQTDCHFGVASYFESRGVDIFYYPKIFKKKFQMASMVSGNAMVHLYFRGQGGWKEPVSLDWLAKQYGEAWIDLQGHPAVDLLMGREDDGWIHVLGKGGRVRIRENGGMLSFENLDGNPLGLPEAKGDLNSADSHAVTLNTLYPDSLVQIAQIFRSSRAGDVILSAAKGHDFRRRYEHPEHKSSHGSLHADHMWVPLLSNVPMTRSEVRTADLFPSVLKLKGASVPPGIDGAAFF